MAAPGQIPGRYNLVINDSYDTVDHQVPIDEFLEQLRSNSVPHELCVVGLEDAFDEAGVIDQLSLEMDKRANDLELVPIAVNRRFLESPNDARDGSSRRNRVLVDEDPVSCLTMSSIASSSESAFETLGPPYQVSR